MPKKLPATEQKPARKKFSLEFLEGDVIKITGIVLTILVATQIVFVKGFHLVKEMRADVLGSHESAETYETSSTEETQADIKEQKDSISEDFYKKIVESSKSIILKWDSDGMITYMNSFGAEFFGYTQDEIIGKSMFLLVPGIESTTKRDLNQMLRDIQKDPEKFRSSENENIKKTGERVWVTWTNTAIDIDGKSEILSIGNEDVCDISRKSEIENESPTDNEN
ncbi:PAS domain S-box protein [Patescibacteria group bacterium]|nr:PAS domain S-box protein [Patescibacteria group bacterium]